MADSVKDGAPAALLCESWVRVSGSLLPPFRLWGVLWESESSPCTICRPHNHLRLRPGWPLPHGARPRTGQPHTCQARPPCSVTSALGGEAGRQPHFSVGWGHMQAPRCERWAGLGTPVLGAEVLTPVPAQQLLPVDLSPVVTGTSLGPISIFPVYYIDWLILFTLSFQH